jgi:hypothetical protein
MKRKFQLENMKGLEYLEELGIVRSIIFKIDLLNQVEFISLDKVIKLYVLSDCE